MAENSTVSEMMEGESGKVAWVLRNWKICHTFLVSTSCCSLKVGNASMRFYLKPIEKTYQLKGDIVKVMRFYSLWVEVLSGQKALFLNIQTEIFPEPRFIMDNYSSDKPDSQVVLERPSSSSDSNLLVQERFLYMGSSKIDIFQNRFTEDNYFANLNELKIVIKASIFYIPGTQPSGSKDDISRSLVDDMKKLWMDLSESQNCCHDVELQMEDGTMLPAHKSILAARSPVFRAMFTSGMKESLNKIVPIQKLGSKAMKILLRFMYTDEIGDEWEEYGPDLVEVASRYDLPDLLKFCDKNLIKICNVNTALELYKLAKLYSLETAMRHLTDFTKAHTAEVLLNIET